jgi:hypothetical protein
VQSKDKSHCPDCGVRIGQPHQTQCDVARCEACGGQRMTCGYQDQGHDAIPWGGDWPGAAECRRRGWWARLVPGEGWRPCAQSEPGASEDLNRLAFLQAEGFDGLYDQRAP